MPAPNYSVPPPDDRQTVVCLYCNKPQDISRKAQRHYTIHGCERISHRTLGY